MTFRIRFADDRDTAHPKCFRCKRRRHPVHGVWSARWKKYVQVCERCSDRQPYKAGARCSLCEGMSWRVEGPRCRRCKLEYAEERVEPQPAPRQSNMAYAAEMLGGEE